MDPGQASLLIRNRQRARKLDTRQLRRIVLAAVEELQPPGGFDLAFYLVSAVEMAGVNETYLQHEGPTDVITFDYGEGEGSGPLHGEIFTCVEQAVIQAREFRTTWQSEVVRYAVHGILHLLGYDDRTGRLRRRMKEAENRLVKALARRFDFRCLALARC